METQEPITRFEYELLHEEDGRYLANLDHSISGAHASMPYKIGDEIPLSEKLIHGSNSNRLRRCFITRIARDANSPNKYFVYLRPTRQEFKPFASLDGEKISKGRVNGIDWSGLDGWLQIS